MYSFNKVRIIYLSNETRFLQLSICLMKFTSIQLVLIIKVQSFTKFSVHI